MSNERVVVAGGGFAGLETAFLLNLRLHADVDITLVSDQDHFLFRPNTIYIPFGLDPDELKIPLERPSSRQDIAFVGGRVRAADVGASRLELDSGESVAYDRLVLATGAAMRPEEIPGLAEHANTIWTPADMLQLRDQIERIVEKGKDGKKTRLVFLVPPNNKCSGPLYEMAMVVETHFRREGVRDWVDMVWTTSEQSYIMAFGPRLHEVSAEFDERVIEGLLEHVVTEVEEDRVLYENGTEIEYDELISPPPYVAAMEYDGLPSDDRGFLTTDFDTRRVEGTENIYAPGDAGDFPVKQAFLAFLQTDAVAETLVGEIRGQEPRVTFDPISMCVMEPKTAVADAASAIQELMAPWNRAVIDQDWDAVLSMCEGPRSPGLAGSKVPCTKC